MKVKLHGNDILCEDFIPSIKIGEFNSELVDSAKKLLILDANFGQEFSRIYEEGRKNFHIENITTMLKQIEEVFKKYDAEKFRIERKFKWDM